MGKLHACFVVAVGALAAACGDDGGSATQDAAVIPDSKVWMDAAIDAPPMFDLTCIGNNPPTAAANVTLSGTAQVGDITIPQFQFVLTPIEDADVDLCNNTACTGQGNDGTTTTAADGTWSIGPIATTGGAGIDDYLMMSKMNSNVRTTLVYPHAPFTVDTPNIPFLNFGPTAGGFLAMQEGCEDSTDPLILIAVTDCANEPITDDANIVISIKQGGTAVSTAEIHPLSGIPMAPPEIAGLFLVCGVPASDATEITATYNGMNLLGNTVRTIASGTTSMQIRPGY